LLGADEWRSVPADTQHIEKIADLKYLACPISVITRDTWDLIKLVNLCADKDGNIHHLPEPEFPITDQSERFLVAHEMVVRERNSEWFRQLQEERAK
jgi:hypothetical protein